MKVSFNNGRINEFAITINRQIGTQVNERSRQVNVNLDTKLRHSDISLDTDLDTKLEHSDTVSSNITGATGYVSSKPFDNPVFSLSRFEYV